MTALEGHDSVDFQESLVSSKGSVGAIPGKHGILAIDGNPIRFSDQIMDLLRTPVYPELPSFANSNEGLDMVGSHPLAASWPKSPAQKSRRRLDIKPPKAMNICGQAKHPSPG